MQKLLSAVVVAAAIMLMPAKADPVPHLNVGSSLELLFETPGQQHSFHIDVPSERGIDYLLLDSPDPGKYRVDVRPTGNEFFFTPAAVIEFSTGSYDIVLTLLSLLDPPVIVSFFDINTEITLDPAPPTIGRVETPLPAALPLMGTVLLTGYFVSRYRRRRAAA
jgi:hypothetical protein